jgi:putative spermidine/putrescine transport system permease protein
MSAPLLAAKKSTRAFAWLVVCFLILPVTIIIPVSLTDRSYLSLPAEGLSTRHYVKLFTSPDWLSSFGQSFSIAIVSTVVALVLGSLCAIGCWRLGDRVASAVRLLMLVPLIVPAIAFVLGFYKLLADLSLLDSYAGVIIAHTVTGIPYVFITVSAALAGLDVRLEQAARNLGANGRQVIGWVVLPNVRAGLASGALFAFMHSWDDLLLVLFIAGRAVYTLPRRMWDGIHYQLDPTMAAVAVVLIAITTLFLSFDLFIRRRVQSRGG